MEKITNRLQFLHSNTIYDTIDDIRSARNKWCMKNGGSLYAEPMVFLLGDGNGGANLVLAIGKDESDAAFINLDGTNESIKAIERELDSDTKAIEKLSSLFDDLKKFCGGTGEFKSAYPELASVNNLASAIDTLFVYLKTLGIMLTGKGIETNTTKTTVTQMNECQEIGVDVTLSKLLTKGERAYSNDIIINTDGLFSNVEVSISGNKLVVAKNGEVKEFELPEEKYVSSGSYSIEKEGINLTLNNGDTVFVDLKSLLNEWKTNNYGKPIVLTKKRVEYETEDGVEYQDELSADIKLYKSDEYIDNIINTDEDGCVYVDMNKISKRIDDAVGSVVCNTSKTQGNIVKMMSDGLYASVNLDYIPESNSLVFNNGLGDSKVYQLEDFASLSEPVEYNVVNDTLHIHYLTNTGRNLHISIPLGPIWQELQVENKNSNVELKIQRSEFGHTFLSANAKISSDENNLLKVQDGNLIVKVDGSLIRTDNGKTVDQRFASVDDDIDKIEESISSITGYTKDMSDEISALKNNLVSTNETISGISNNITSITNKINRHTSRLKNLETESSEIKDSVKALSDSQLTTENVRSTVETMGYAKSSTVSALSALLENQTSKLNTTDEKVTALQTSVEAIQSATSSLSGELNSLSSTVDAIERQIGDVVSGQSKYVTTNEFTTSIDELRNDIVLNSRAIALVNSALENAKEQLSSRIAGDEDKIDANIEKINQLTLRVSAIESSVSNISNTIKSIILDNISLTKTEGSTKTTYILKYGSTYLGEPIEVPNATASSIVTKVAYDNITHTLVITWSNGQETSVPLTDLVNIYEAGNGLEMTSNVFSVKIADDSKDFLSVNAGGLSFKTSKIDELNTAIAWINAEIASLDALIEKNKDDISSILNHSSIDSFNDMVDYVNEMKGQLNERITTEVANLNTQISSLDRQLTSLNNNLTGSTKSLSDRIDTLSLSIDQKMAKEVSDRNLAIHNAVDDLEEKINKKADDFRVFNRAVDDSTSALVLEMNVDGDGKRIIKGDVELSKNLDNMLINTNGALYVPNNAYKFNYKDGVSVGGQLDLIEEQIQDLIKPDGVTIVSKNVGNKIVEGTDKGAYFDGSLDYGIIVFP